MTRTPRVAALLLTVALVVTACTSGTTTTTEPGTATTVPAEDITEETLPIDTSEPPPEVVEFVEAMEPDEEQYDGTEITVLLASLPAAQTMEWFQPAVQTKFGIDVNVVRVPFERIAQATINDVAGGVGAYDVVLIPPRLLGDLAANEYLQPLDDFAAQWDPELDDVFPAYRELYNKAEGQLFALMMDGDRLELYYRTDLFEHPDEQAAFQEEYGYQLAAPETWDQYLDVAEFFTRDAGEELAGETLSEPFYGISEFFRSPDLVNWWLGRYAAYGGTYFDDELNPQLNTEAGVLATENLIETMEYGPPGVINFGYPESYGAFIQGQTAMVIQWTDVAKGAEDPEASLVTGNVGYAQIPGVEDDNGDVVHRVPLAYNRVLAISAMSQNPEAAYRVIEFLSSFEVSQLYVTGFGGLDPFRESHYADPDEWVEQWETLPDYIDNSVQSIENGFPELTMPGSIQYQDALGQQLAAALAGEADIETALAEAEDQWNAISEELDRDLQLEFWQAQRASWEDVGLLP